MKITELDRAQLVQLRSEILFTSVFVSDYQNTLGIEPHEASAFFDGYADYLSELMKEDGLTDSDFYTFLEDYDTEDNLYCWWLVYSNTHEEAKQ